MKDVIYSHKEKPPEREYYEIYINNDGTKHYYLLDLKHLARYEALYGVLDGRWSYTNNDADKTYG